MTDHCKGCRALVELYKPVCIKGNYYGDCPCYMCIVKCMCMAGCPAFTDYLTSIKDRKGLRICLIIVKDV